MSKLVAFLLAGALHPGVLERLGTYLLVPLGTAIIVGVFLHALAGGGLLPERSRPFAPGAGVLVGWLTWCAIEMKLIAEHSPALYERARFAMELDVILNGAAVIFLVFFPGIISTSLATCLNLFYLVLCAELWAQFPPASDPAHALVVNILLRISAVVLTCAGCGYALRMAEEDASPVATTKPASDSSRPGEDDASSSLASIALCAVVFLLAAAQRYGVPNWFATAATAPAGSPIASDAADATDTSSNSGLLRGRRERVDGSGRRVVGFFCDGERLPEEDQRAVAMKMFDAKVRRSSMTDRHRRYLESVVCSHGVDAVSRLYPTALAEDRGLGPGSGFGGAGLREVIRCRLRRAMRSSRSRRSPTAGPGRRSWRC